MLLYTQCRNIFKLDIHVIISLYVYYLVMRHVLSNKYVMHYITFVSFVSVSNLEQYMYISMLQQRHMVSGCLSKGENQVWFYYLIILLFIF